MKILKSFSALMLVGAFSTPAALHANPQLIEMQQRCAELSANQQLRPFTVSLTCRQQGTVWRETDAAHVTVENALQVTAAFSVKEFLSESIPEPVIVDSTQAACTVLEKFDTMASVDLELTCADLNLIDNVTEFCVAAIDDRIQQNPEQYLEESTGVYLNTCNGFSAEQSEGAQIIGQK
jgi:hypothetical protein